MRLLTDGGIPFVAMQRYGPIWYLFTLVMFSTDPTKVLTESKKIHISLVKSYVTLEFVYNSCSTNHGLLYNYILCLF